MITFMEHRVADPRILRLIRKWLKAGVMEEGQWSEPQKCTPQGSVFTVTRQRVPASQLRSLGERPAQEVGDLGLHAEARPFLQPKRLDRLIVDSVVHFKGQVSLFFVLR